MRPFTEWQAAAGALVSILALSACGGGDPSAETGDPVVIAAVGDIACDPDAEEFNDGRGTKTECRHVATARLVTGIGPDAFLALGDLQYDDGTEFDEVYDKTWGRFKPITFPVPGNHEYQSKGARGYYAYFGKRAGSPKEGYYSFDLGSWHVVALNANCPAVGGCEPDSPQGEWLRKDLEANQTRCTLAFWHQPRFSSGWHGDYEDAAGFWTVLEAHDADVVLNGHDHDYERFAPQDSSGRHDPRGMTEFVVGTGGKSLRDFEEIKPASVARTSLAYGVLEMSLAPEGYTWRFHAAGDSTFTDSGSEPCR